MNKKILIVDDEQDILEILKILLESRGYEVIVDISAEKVENLDLINPGLILLDSMLKGKDGRDICKKIKSQPAFKNIPIIFLSADADLHIIAEDCKAEGYLRKPFELNEILSAVETNLNRK